MGRKDGRSIAGPAFNMYYDEEYKEEIADFESCFPIKKSIEAEGIYVRELPGGFFLSCLHHGPYEKIYES